MVAINGAIWMFGGTNGNSTLNDMWKFDLAGKKWECVETKDTP